MAGATHSLPAGVKQSVVTSSKFRRNTNSGIVNYLTLSGSTSASLHTASRGQGTTNPTFKIQESRYDGFTGKAIKPSIRYMTLKQAQNKFSASYTTYLNASMSMESSQHLINDMRSKM